MWEVAAESQEESHKTSEVESDIIDKCPASSCIVRFIVGIYCWEFIHFWRRKEIQKMQSLKLAVT